MSKEAEASNFLAWLAEDVEVVTAVPSTPRDAQLKDFADKGFLKFSSCVHGTNYYAITSKWMQVR
jgi:hypothetical protein